MISAEAFKTRRQAILAQLPEDAVAIIPAGVELYRNGDTHYPFRQHSDFWYLTGFAEPDAVLVLTQRQSILFCKPRCPEMEVWTGPIFGPEAAKDQLFMDVTHSVEHLEMELVKIFKGCTAIYYPFLHAGKWEKILFTAWKKARHQVREDRYLSSAFADLAPMIAELRLFKSEAEIACMQKAIDCSVAAHLEVMQHIRNLNYEYEAAAIFHQKLGMQGCVETAYPTIVASGSNACVLHYTKSNRAFQNQDLFLIDAGGEWQGYAADITRTYPVRGQWTREQQAIYELVLAAQEEAIKCIRPDCEWTRMQTVIVKILTQGLLDLGILKGSLEGLIQSQAYKPFYMHNSGHWLGLDVHDVGSYYDKRQPRLLASGMVLTVEPGIYISPQQPGIEDKWRGIGVRIEDDILVTAMGYKNLSEALPKSISALKASISHV